MKKINLFIKQKKQAFGYNRVRSANLYHTHRWTRLSKIHREMNPLCEECKRQGRLVEGEVTDHIIPYPLCDFWDESNWQTLCKRCNTIKGAKDKKMIRKQRNALI